MGLIFLWFFFISWKEDKNSRAAKGLDASSEKKASREDEAERIGWQGEAEKEETLAKGKREREDEKGKRGGETEKESRKRKGLFWYS